jgi:RNA polymerase sigma-32 factor
MENPMTQALVAHNMPIPASIGTLDAYISTVNRIPVLSVEEEQGLARQYQAEQDLESARRLVLSHLRFRRARGAWLQRLRPAAG